MSIEKLVLENLLYNEGYTRRVLPFLREDYFGDLSQKHVFTMIGDFYSKYNKSPTKEVLDLSINSSTTLIQKQVEDCIGLVNVLSSENKQDEQWLVDETEKFCKDKAIYNAILESIHIIEGKNKTKTTEALPSILSDALGVSFDTKIGHDYIKDAELRYDFYHKPEQKISFDIDYLNKITNDGVSNKTLNVVIAGTGVGKSLFLCHHAANCLVQHKNVLYITCEMAEERIAERIDANIMDITLDELKTLPKDIYAKKLFNATRGIKGKLIIKEYPTSTANANHIRHLLDDLYLKKKFKPDIVFVDYLNICSSSRFKQAVVNSYTYVKAVAEELRGLAVEKNVPIFTATQTNRQGFSNTDLSLEDTSESFGLPQTADFMFALITTEDLEKRGYILVKQLKNRYKDVCTNRKFLIGISRAKMKLSNLDEQIAQDGLVGVGFEDEVQNNKAKYKVQGKTIKDKVNTWQFE